MTIKGGEKMKYLIESITFKNGETRTDSRPNDECAKYYKTKNKCIHFEDVLKEEMDKQRSD